MRTTALTLVLNLFASTAWVAPQPDSQPGQGRRWAQNTKT